MGGERLSACLRHLHHSGRRGSGPVRAATFLRRRDRAVRSGLDDDRARSQRSRGHRRTRAARIRRRLRRCRHAGGSDRSRPRSEARRRHRRLDRFPDAGLQHRAARGRRLDALCGMASGVLAERCGDGAGGAGAVAESRDRGTKDQAGGLAGTLPPRRVHGDADLRTARPARRAFRAAGRDRSAGAGRDRTGRTDLGGDASSSPPARLRPVRRPELRARLRADLPPHVRHHDPSPLLQPVRAGPGRDLA